MRKDQREGLVGRERAPQGSTLEGVGVGYVGYVGYVGGVGDVGDVGDVGGVGGVDGVA